MLYELCDELGMLVLNEALRRVGYPKRKWLKGWNVGEPGYDGSCDIFARYAEEDLADMVRRDRNHISIFAWSIGNEIDYLNDVPIRIRHSTEAAPAASRSPFSADTSPRLGCQPVGRHCQAAGLGRKTLRPFASVTAGLAGVAMSNCTEYPSALDITGYNYTESRYDSDHETYPERVIFGSENRHDIEAWRAVAERPHIFGQFLWTGIDYLGEIGSVAFARILLGTARLRRFSQAAGAISGQPCAARKTRDLPGQLSDRHAAQRRCVVPIFGSLGPAPRWMRGRSGTTGRAK